jgi:WD40 repeat protein
MCAVRDAVTTLSCKPYSNALGAYTAATAGTTFNPSTGSVAPQKMSNFSENGYVATSADVEPYIKMYRNKSTVYADLNNNRYASGKYGPFVAAADIPDSKPTLMVFSRNAEYLFISDQVNYAKMWGRFDENRYKLLTEIADGSTDLVGACYGDITAIGGAAFSPDNKYFAISCLSPSGSNRASVKIWKITAGVAFHPTSTPDMIFEGYDPGFSGGMNNDGAIENIAPTIAFSPDSKYMVIAGGDSTHRAINSNIIMYMIGENDLFTPIEVSSEQGAGNYDWQDGNTYPTNGTGISFTKDSNHLLVPVSHSTNGMAVFRRYSPTEFRNISGSYTATPFQSATPITVLSVAK